MHYQKFLKYYYNTNGFITPSISLVSFVFNQIYLSSITSAEEKPLLFQLLVIIYYDRFDKIGNVVK